MRSIRSWFSKIFCIFHGVLPPFTSNNFTTYTPRCFYQRVQKTVSIDLTYIRYVRLFYWTSQKPSKIEYQNSKNKLKFKVSANLVKFFAEKNGKHVHCPSWGVNELKWQIYGWKCNLQKQCNYVDYVQKLARKLRKGRLNLGKDQE